MKRLGFVAMMSVAIFMLNACGGSKPVVDSQKPVVDIPGKNINGEEFALNECQKLALERPATRAYGVADKGRLSDAKAFAELDARAQLSRVVYSKMKGGLADEMVAFEKIMKNRNESGGVADEGNKEQLWNSLVSEAVLSNVAVIHVNQYVLPSGFYRVYVCLEYLGSTSDMAKAITRTLEQQVPDEDRLKMEYEFKKFREQVEKELGKEEQK